MDNAYDAYTEVERRFKLLQTTCRDDTMTEEKRKADILSFANRAARCWTDISSDYQQNKSIPAWNKSPQPGPTYYLSGLKHYVHIICCERFCHSTGPIRFSRNLVYTRSEQVGGAKVSDDKLPTVSNALTGYKTPAFPQPILFRIGYDINGKVIDL